MQDRIGVQFEADLSDWSSSVNKILKDENRVEDAMAGIVDAANQAERALNNISSVDANVKVNVDTGELETANRLQSDLNENVSTKVDVDASEVEATQDMLQQIRDLQAIQVGISVGGIAGGLLTNPGELPIVGQVLEMDAALRQVEGTTGRMIPEAEYLINTLYTENWGESRTQIANVIIEASNLGIAMGDLESATRAAFQVTTVTGGETNETLRAMNSLVKNDLVSSYSEAADIIVAGFQNGADRGQDLLDTLNEYGSTFAEAGLTGQEALALINSGLEAGVDNSDRIADAIRETGIRLADISEDPNIAAAFEKLDSLSSIDLQGSFDAFQAGEATAGEFYGAFFGALEEVAASDQTQAQNIADVLVGTIAEDFGIEAISQLTPVWDESMGALEGRAEEAANTISGSLGGSIESLRRTVESELVNTFTELVDVEALTAQLNEAVSRLGEELRGGATIGEAIEVALNIPGFNDAVNTFQSTVGNFAIEAGLIVASVLDFMGKSEQASAVRRSVVDASEGQLRFDTATAVDAEGVEQAIRLAVARGVSSDEVLLAARETFNEAIAGGEVGLAQDIANGINTFTQEATGRSETSFQRWIDEANTAAATVRASFDEAMMTGDLQGMTAAAQQLQDPELIAIAEQAGQQLRASYEAAIARGDLENAGLLAVQIGDQALVEEVATKTEETAANVQTAFTNLATFLQGIPAQTQPPVDQMAEGFNAILTSAQEVLPTTQEEWLAFVTDFAGNIDIALQGLGKFKESLLEISALVDESGIQNVTGGGGGGGGGTTSASPQRAGGGAFSGLAMVGERGTEMITAPGSGAFAINAASTQSIMGGFELIAAAMQAANAPVYDGGREVNVTVNNNVQNDAQAYAAGRGTIDAIRGY